MALILRKLFQGYFWLFREKSDTRADEYFLMSSIFLPITIAFSYVYIVTNVGPKFMKNRQPFNIEKWLIVYNLIQVLYNSYMIVKATRLMLKVNVFCSPVDYSDSPDSRLALDLAYAYFITKLIDLLDTVFFILRKKDRQLTFLHIYHHFGMVLLSWVGVKFLAGGHSLFLGYINAIVHAVMYFYYLLSSWSPEYKNSLWWKKYITQLQMAQFFILLVIYSLVLFQPSCGYPKIACFFFIPQNLFMLILFSDFYIKAYIKKDRKK